MEITQESQCAGLVMTKDGTTGLRKFPHGDTTPTSAELDNIRTSLYFIGDPSKPIRAISAYGVNDLVKIAQTLGVDSSDPNGKRKLKKKLYEDIIACL